MSSTDWSLFYADLEYLEELIHSKFHRNPNEHSNFEEEVNIATEIENQILKVSAHYNNTFKELNSKLTAFRINLNSNTISQSKSSKEKLFQEINNIQQTITQLALFCEENYTALTTLLQLHDRDAQNENEKMCLLFSERLKDLRNYPQKMAKSLLLFNDCCARARLLFPSPQNKKVEKKETKRYFLRKEDILQIKCEITKHLPIYFLKKNNFKQMGGKKTAEETADYSTISTSYFENPQKMEIYLNRINQLEGVSGVRVRTFSRSTNRSANDKPMTVFVEKKGKKGKDVEERKVELNYHLIFDYLKGNYDVNDYLMKLKNFSYSEKDLVKFARVFGDVQSIVVKKNLKEIFTSQFDRTVFMEEGDHSLIISIDQNIRFYKGKGKCISNFWQSQKSQNFDQQFNDEQICDVFDFPYAILEIKSSRPGDEWLCGMRSSNLLRPVENFSKFLHGTALFFPSSLPYFPHWLNKFDNSLPFPNRDLSPNFIKNGSGEIKIEEVAKEEDQSEAMSLDVYENSEFADIVANLGLNKQKEKEESQPWFIKFMYSIGYPIIPEHSLSPYAKIDPKTYFANERTLLKWISICLIIQAGGIAFIKFIDLGFTSLFTGISMMFFSLVFLLYAVFQYKIRNYLISYRQDDRFEDEYGPILLYFVILVLALINSVFYFSESLIDHQYYY